MKKLVHFFINLFSARSARRRALTRRARSAGTGYGVPRLFRGLPFELRVPSVLGFLRRSGKQPPATGACYTLWLHAARHCVKRHLTCRTIDVSQM